MLDNSHLIDRQDASLKRVVPLKQFMVKEIDNSQNIKRLCRYYTRTPLLNKGLLYGNTTQKMNQPDLIDTLTQQVKNDVVSGTAKERIIYNYSFSDEAMSERQISIYVHCYKTVFNPNMASNRTHYGVDEIIGKHYFNIDIVYATETNELDSLYTERANMIACEILTLLNRRYITEKDDVYDYVGNCEIALAGEITDLRQRTSGYMVMTIPLYVTVFGGKISVNELGGEPRYA